MHTPLTISTTCDHRPAIADARGINIASWDPATIELFDDVRPDIVNAVNSYEVMREALKLSLRNVEAQLYVLPVHESEQKDILSSWIGHIKHAMALAEGKD